MLTSWNPIVPQFLVFPQFLVYSHERMLNWEKLIEQYHIIEQYRVLPHSAHISEYARGNPYIMICFLYCHILLSSGFSTSTLSLGKEHNIRYQTKESKIWERSNFKKYSYHLFQILSNFTKFEIQER